MEETQEIDWEREFAELESRETDEHEKARRWRDRERLKAEEVGEAAVPKETLPMPPPPSMLTLRNLNTREDPNPSLNYKLRKWYSHKTTSTAP